MFDQVKSLSQLTSLSALKKGAIVVVLLGVTVAVGLSVYSSYKLRMAHQLEAQADVFRAKAMTLRSEADGFKTKADILQGKLEKADAKVAKLQAEVDKIVVPPAPVEAPKTVKETLVELNNMGLILVRKPSVLVAPCVVGLTADDAVQVWFWGKDALRVPALELKLEKTTDLAKGLDKAKGLAESLAEMKGKESEAWHKAADKHLEEADALKVAVADSKSALAAQRKKTALYAVAAFGLGFVVNKR